MSSVLTAFKSSSCTHQFATFGFLDSHEQKLLPHVHINTTEVTKETFFTDWPKKDPRCTSSAALSVELGTESTNPNKGLSQQTLTNGILD